MNNSQAILLRELLLKQSRIAIFSPLKWQFSTKIVENYYFRGEKRFFQRSSNCIPSLWSPLLKTKPTCLWCGPMHNAHIVKQKFLRVVSAGRWLKFQGWNIMKHIFFPALTTRRTILFSMFSSVSNSKFLIFLQNVHSIVYGAI